MNGLLIRKPTQPDLQSVHHVFERTIPDAFEKEGLGFWHDFIHREIMYKKCLLNASFDLSGSDTNFLIAEADETVIGTISFGNCGEVIKKSTESQFHSIGELGSLYVLPLHQGQGVGSALINAMVEHVSEQGMEQFWLDSGYRHAQKRWLKKFGLPYKVMKNYWGPELDHMIWLCKVSDLIESP
mgnify:CR=1 FL=1